MARIRSIKPEFPQSESMGRVSRESRLCFILLWTLADDVGRLRGNSRMLASLLYPYDKDAGDHMDAWLTELDAERCIRRYEVNGDSYIEICNWLKYQKIDKPSASKLPDFVEPSPKARDDSPNIRERSSEEGKGKEGRGEDAKPRDLLPEPTVSSPPRTRKPAATRIPDGFEISGRVRTWAEAKGHARLDEHLEHFVGTARAKGYTYVDWDDAFMNAIRNDWADLASKPAPGAPRKLAI